MRFRSALRDTDDAAYIFLAVAIGVAAGAAALDIAAVLSGFFCGAILLMWAVRQFLAGPPGATVPAIAAGRGKYHTSNSPKRDRAGSDAESGDGSDRDATLIIHGPQSDTARRGRLMVHRLYSPRNLQIDINLLTATFPTALADALDRTLAHSAQVIPLPEQDTSLIAAQAG